MTKELDTDTLERSPIDFESGEFTQALLRDLAPQIARYSLVPNPEMTTSEVEEKLEEAKSSQEVAVVLGKAVVVDDQNLATELFALTPKSLEGQFTQGALFAAAIATAKADMVEKSGVSGKVRQKLQTLKDDVLWFLIGKSSTAPETWKRNVYGRSRKKFLATAASATAVAILWACGGVPGGVGAIVTPDGQSPAASVTMPSVESPTPTQEVTPTPEIAKMEPGTVYLNPEFDLNDQIEIIPENAQAYYDYFLAALMRVNPVEAAALTTAEGEAVFDTNATDQDNAARMRTYLTENDWLVPAGWRINSGGGRTAGGSYTQLNKFNKPLNVRNLSIELIGYEQYQEMTVYPNITLDISYLFAPVLKGVRVGFNLVDKGDSYILAVQIVDGYGNNVQGFANKGELLTAGDVNWLDQYATYVLYILRAFSVDPPVELKNDYSYPYFSDTDDQGVGIYNGGTDHFFEDYHRLLPADSPTPILQKK